MNPMKVQVSDTSVLIDLERGTLLETCFRLPFQFAVPDLLREIRKRLRRWRQDSH